MKSRVFISIRNFRICIWFFEIEFTVFELALEFFEFEVTVFELEATVLNFVLSFLNLKLRFLNLVLSFLNLKLRFLNLVLTFLNLRLQFLNLVLTFLNLVLSFLNLKLKWCSPSRPTHLLGNLMFSMSLAALKKRCGTMHGVLYYRPFHRDNWGLIRVEINKPYINAVCTGYNFQPIDDNL